MESTALKNIEAYRRSVLADLLAQCTPEQQGFFQKLYGTDINAIPDAKVNWAIQQCENTIRKNETKAKKE